MSDVLRVLDHRVAEAAEAWLADPRDTAVYARLVAAVAERRATIDARRLRAVDAPALEDDADDAGDGGGDAGPGGGDGADVADGADGAAPDDRADAEGAGDPGRRPEVDDDPDRDPDEDPVPPLRPVGADLLGDPRAVLDRLRRP